ncbi:YggS family pyridoxal phosphate-dependent enzyme [Enterococcus dongliensis]|uniref:Pyridoxal phosphate homeostasis protein n=1 Tax=Enterococcus dongliensis TaxID=2559925 RepID=A0AAP5NJM6_9ENTE|nr:YggS family pyridoxal phosphate-dependent enzyme [Enterococcus dongliensis]MDT2596833.1 YggS family pyridoxal phosphate-dependent enzyme [Enterococcus dongliensis]MDT2603149.1 YggS family pyridoxal phosphate-dependent enzyme [Enterococcus dongliensis]MDT2613714.1 YggS family pyridoxal phosphate-dependent enzyme [Enterococcus dongliensis]MDT2633493.1 YggS family pyridoxal phosphate-dependent enzyme [Enterococcus dongliensis]MDT2636133.1 YggS family pyridoxal phosphate-dependent enzyme [Enter
MIAENLHRIEQEIQESCALVSRNPQDITMVAVTKSVDSMTANELVELGVTDLAENRVDKLLEKKQNLSQHQQLHWHLIGNLQRRKVKLIINEIDYFHALDSLRLAQEIQKRAERPINCFIEVNVSGEESKHGIKPEELHSFIKELADLDKVKIVGLMTMAPYEASQQSVRKIFATLKQLQESVKNQNLQYAPCTELSMGMSQDFKTAIEEGATFVRIGTALFKKG